MPENPIQSRIATKVWKALAQSGIDVSTMSKQDLDALVELITNTVLVEIDKTLDDSEAKDKDASAQFFASAEGDKEKVLWKGRPFLSISEHYVITNQRVRFIKGLLGKQKKDIELVRIQDLSQSQTLRERTLNLGDITIHSHDRSDPILTLNNIRDPEDVHEILRRAVLEARKGINLTFQEEM